MLYIVIFVFFLYYLLLLAIIAGWQIAVQPKEENSDFEANDLITVLIPFRDEEKYIAQLCEQLSQQTYSSIEVIFIDDHSTDQGPAKLAEVLSGTRFRLIRNVGEGKKIALTTGVSAAKGSIIVTTDADCYVKPGWLEEIAKPFRNQEVKFVFGLVRIKAGSSFFSLLQSMEFSTVIATGVAAFSWGFPIYCNGANLAFRKNVFEELDGYAGNLNLPSGDDEFLLKKTNARYPGSIRFVNSPVSVVGTVAQPDITSFVHQRLRWAGKWRYASGTPSKLIAISFALVQFTILYLFGRLLFFETNTVLMFALFGKVLLEFVLIFLVQQFYREKTKLWPFIVLQLVYPIYFVGIGIFSMFSSYSWKSRVWKNKG